MGSTAIYAWISLGLPASIPIKRGLELSAAVTYAKTHMGDLYKSIGANAGVGAGFSLPISAGLGFLENTTRKHPEYEANVDAFLTGTEYNAGVTLGAVHVSGAYAIGVDDSKYNTALNAGATVAHPVFNVEANVGIAYGVKLNDPYGR